MIRQEHVRAVTAVLQEELDADELVLLTYSLMLRMGHVPSDIAHVSPSDDEFNALFQSARRVSSGTGPVHPFTDAMHRRTGAMRRADRDNLAFIVTGQILHNRNVAAGAMPPPMRPWPAQPAPEVPQIDPPFGADQDQTMAQGTEVPVGDAVTALDLDAAAFNAARARLNTAAQLQNLERAQPTIANVRMEITGERP